MGGRLEQGLVDVLNDVRRVVNDPTNQCQGSLRLEVCDLLEQLHDVHPTDDARLLGGRIHGVPQRVVQPGYAGVVMTDLPIDPACIDKDVQGGLTFCRPPRSFDVAGGCTGALIEGRFAEDDVGQ